jgi:hypothetical protein
MTTVQRKCCGATLKQQAYLLLSKAQMARSSRIFTPYATRSEHLADVLELICERSRNLLGTRSRNSLPDTRTAGCST